MQLEQNETFEIKGPQLEVLGEAESKLPAPARKRPVAAAVLAAAVLLSVFGIGGAKLKGEYKDVSAVYTEQVDRHGNGIQGDFAVLLDDAASLTRQCQKALGESSAECAAVTELVDRWESTPVSPAAQYEVFTELNGAVDVMYGAARTAADGETLARIESLDASYVSNQSILEREIAQNYTPAAQSYNETAGQFPASLIVPLWGVGEAELFAPQ